MMKKKCLKYICVKIISASVLMVLWHVNAFAQQKSNPCSNTLYNANKEYEEGRFSQCVEMLKLCLKNLGRDERFEAHRLLVLSYINLNDDKNANEEAANVLIQKPDYKEFPYVDPPELTKILGKYDVSPLLEMGLKAGINFNSVNPLKNYSISGSGAEFLPGTGYQAGFLVEYYLKKKISVNAELLYEGLNYTRTAANVSGWQQEFKERLNYFNIPITCRYYFYKWKDISVGAELGMQMQLFNATNSNITLTNPASGASLQNTAEQNGQRNTSLFYALAGLSVKYKFGGGHLGANIRYAYGLNNVVNADKRYDDMDFILSNQYIDSDISFNPLYFSISYQFPLIYSVKAIKQSKNQ